MRKHVSEGKTVELAIEDALKKLQVSRDEVNVEILKQPSKSVFGRKNSPAVVSVTLKEPALTQPTSPGSVSVVNGQLRYTPPQASGIAASLRFGSEFHVLYQGEVVEKELVLSEGLDPLEIILPEHREPELHYEIIINPEKTQADLWWRRNQGVMYALADRAATNRLDLAIKKTPVDAPVLTLQDVQQLIQIEGLKYGITLAELTPELLESPHGLVTIAKGLTPEKSQPPTITYTFQEEAPVIDPDAIRIDHYEVHGIQGVESGAVLAVKNPGHPGKPGIDVYGEPILLDPMTKVDIAVGEGVTLSADGLQAIATVPGLPSLQSGVLRVTNVFELEGDADVSTGNITMDGSIIIKGNVLENVKVESSTGVIVVNGLVSGAILRTSGSITVLRNVVRSQLFAGGATVTQIRLLSMLQQIGDQLGSLIAAYDAIVTQADNIPFENLIKHLLELKFYDLPKQTKELADYVEQLDLDLSDNLVLLKEALVSCLLGMGPLRITSVDLLKQLYARVREQVLQLESSATTEADITVGYLQNSRVEASGQVEITGQGCFYSTVLAGTGFKLANGVFRGGEVTLNTGAMVAKEFGGPTGIATQAQLINNGRITVNRVYPNVSVVIGTQSYKFDDVATQVKVFLQGGILTVYSGSNKIHG